MFLPSGAQKTPVDCTNEFFANWSVEVCCHCTVLAIRLTLPMTIVLYNEIATSVPSGDAASSCGGVLREKPPPNEPAIGIALMCCPGCVTFIAHRRKWLESLLLRGECVTVTSVVLLAQHIPETIPVPSPVT